MIFVEELARVVAAAGGVQSSMAAMKEFPEDVAVQKNGCHALANMAVEGFYIDVVDWFSVSYVSIVAICRISCH